MKYSHFVEGLDKNTANLIEQSETGNQRNARVAARKIPVGHLALRVIEPKQGMFSNGDRDITVVGFVRDEEERVLTFEHRRLILPHDRPLRASTHVIMPPKQYSYDGHDLSQNKDKLSDFEGSRAVHGILRHLRWGRANQDPFKHEAARNTLIEVLAASAVSQHAESMYPMHPAIVEQFQDQLTARTAELVPASTLARVA